MAERKQILSLEAAQQKITRMALEIVEDALAGENQIILVGLKERGWAIANKISTEIKPYLEQSPMVARIDYENDDLQKPIFIGETPNLDNKNVILIDDVSNTGETQYFALKLFLPKPLNSLRTLVLVERLHKKFPIKSDYVGVEIATTFQDYIKVDIDANGKVQGAYLENK